jgi:hypothetical protein
MQAASFGKRGAADAENADEAVAVAIAESPAADETVDSTAAEAPNAADAASQEAKEATPSADAAAAADAPPWDMDPADSAPANAPSPSQPKPEVPKKSKKEKIELPEGKVSLTATVQEFTTVPNHFSDTDDEVIIYEAVSITDPAVELGTAWSSHSATIKKLELAVGDKITFEAKLVAKKLTKHPVPYKINNAAKIQKV